MCVEHRAPVVAAPWEEAPPRGATARTLPDGDDYHLRLGQLQVRAGPSRRSAVSQLCRILGSITYLHLLLGIRQCRNSFLVQRWERGGGGGW